MKSSLLILTLFALSLNLKAQESSITAVTIYSDRAQITRTLPTQLKGGIQSVEIKGLPAWLDRSSLRAGFENTQTAKVLDVHIDKVLLAEADDAEVKAALAALQELEDQLSDVEDQEGIVAARSKQIESLTTFSMEKIPRDAVTRDIPVQTYKDLVEFATAERTAIAKERRVLERTRRDLAPERNVRQAKLLKLQQKNQLEQINVTITASSEAAVENTLVIKYQLPGATWEPEHEVRIGKDNQVNWISYARVTQTSGEDWEKAEITLSTQSPGTTVTIPELESLLLGRGNTGQILQQSAQQDSFKVANAYYLDNSIAFNGYINPQKAGQMLELQGNWARQQDVQKKVQVTFRELQQRGTTALYQAAGKQTVRTDGNAIRMAIGSLDMVGRPQILAAPEISLNATRSLQLQHGGELPILPGKAGLYLDGSFIGMTRTDFVGSGESFSLFAGLVDTVKITRVLDHEKSSISRGKRENKVKAYFTIEVENLSDQALEIRIADRIPVSDDSAIDVSYVRTSPKVEPDKEGLILWQMNVPARDRQELTLSYTVEYPVDYIQRGKSNGMPSSPAADQLFDLESKF